MSWLMILRITAEKMMKRSPMMAEVKISLPFLTCSGLEPPVTMRMEAIIMMTRAAKPARPIAYLMMVKVKSLV